jgi:hypothetical protein
MHRWALCLALVVCVLAVGIAQADYLNQWQTIDSLTAPPYPDVVEGGSEPGHTLYVCRAVALAGSAYPLLTPGKTWPGLAGCFVSAPYIGYVEQLVTKYQVLLTPPLVVPQFAYYWSTRDAIRSNPALVSYAVQGGYSGMTYPYQPDFFICRAHLTVNGTDVGMHPGSLALYQDIATGVYDGRCLITYGGTSYAAPPPWDILLYK